MVLACIFWMMLLHSHVLIAICVSSYVQYLFKYFSYWSEFVSLLFAYEVLYVSQ